MNKPILGRLTRVTDLRQVWESESGSFTPWLAQEENIAILSEAIGLQLEVEAQEKNVGPFRADILCKDMATDHWVLIENQLERTDHIHLGQLLTYAAGLKAVTIVWIAKEFTDEHRAALDWLNEITDGSFNFFGLEVELWRIGDSVVAPKFNIVCQPNDWSQNVTEGAKGVVQGELSPAKQLQLDFWTSFRDFVTSRGSFIRPTKPLPQVWMSFAIGRAGFGLTAVASTWDSDAESYDNHELRVEMVLFNANAKTYFSQLVAQKAEIEAELGEPLRWAETPGKRQSKIYLRKTVDLEDRSQWNDYHEWIISNLERFHKAFANRVRAL